MTGLTIRRLLLAAGFSLAPVFALGQVPPDPFDPALAEAAMDSFAYQTGAGALMLVAIVAMALFFANQREKRRHELIARFFDQGQQVPPALLPSPPSRQRDMRRGIWLSSWGLGIGLVLYIATSDWRVAAWCLILLFLSAASFANAVLFSRNGSGQ